LGNPVDVKKLINLENLSGAETDWGTNPNMNKPNSKGALGMFQITPIAYKDLQRVKPEIYKKASFQKVATDPVMSQQAVWDLMNINAGYLQHFKLPVNTESLLQAYNVGIGSYRKGKTNPEYIKRYNRPKPKK
jgi:hypothetical protein